MKAITLDKLRTLAAAVANAEQGSRAWDAATDALNAKFSPRCLVTLIDQLEAEQHEKAVNWEAATSLAEENAELKRQLEAAQRERDDSNERLTLVREQRDAEINLNTALEAELKRRDDAVPDDRIVDDGCSQFIGGVQQSDRLNCAWPVGTKFYAAVPAAVPDRNMLRDLVDAVWNYATESAAVPCTGIADGLIDRISSISPQSVESRYATPAAVLPPEIVRNADGFGEYQGRLIGGGAIEWYNQALTDARALGCKPAVRLGVPDGWKMVPIEPTEQMMLNESDCQRHEWNDNDCSARQTRRFIWQRMVEAAPAPGGCDA